eukprot:1161000-Pelagomonas_calceolata.AAC.11
MNSALAGGFITNTGLQGSESRQRMIIKDKKHNGDHADELMAGVGLHESKHNKRFNTTKIAGTKAADAHKSVNSAGLQCERKSKQ